MNVHILSDSPGGVSSYANMAGNLALGLVERGHNVSITGFQTFFRPVNYRGITVYPLINPIDPCNSQLDTFKNNLNKTKAEVLICIHEAYSKWSIYSKCFHNSYIWVPVEGKGIPQMMYDNLQNITPVSQSFFGQDEMKADGIKSNVIYPGWDERVYTQSPELYCKWSTDIHRQTQDPGILAKHGCYQCSGLDDDCDLEIYEPENIITRYQGKEKTREISRIDDIKDEIGAEYVIGCVANNMGKRKNLEGLIKAFSQIENKNYSLLHIHTAITAKGTPLDALIKSYDIDDRVVISYGEYPFSISERAINRLYYYFDIHATASRAEGFGITQMESMAVGTPQIAPDFGTFPELIGKNERGLLANVDGFIPSNNGTVWCEVNTESLADKMDLLYVNLDLRIELGKNAREWAQSYTWDKVVSRWDNYLLEDNKIAVTQKNN